MWVSVFFLYFDGSSSPCRIKKFSNLFFAKSFRWVMLDLNGYIKINEKLRFSVENHIFLFN